MAHLSNKEFNQRRWWKNERRDTEIVGARKVFQTGQRYLERSFKNRAVTMTELFKKDNLMTYQDSQLYLLKTMLHFK